MHPIEKQNAVSKIGMLMEDGLLEALILEMQTELALEIVETSQHEMDKREELYMLNKALKRLNEKLQEYYNNYNPQEEI